MRYYSIIDKTGGGIGQIIHENAYSMRSYSDLFNDVSTLLLELSLEQLYIFKHVEKNSAYDWQKDATQLMKACDEAARYVSTGLWNSHWDEFYESMTKRRMKLPYRLAGSTKNTYRYVLEFQEIDKNQCILNQ